VDEKQSDDDTHGSCGRSEWQKRQAASYLSLCYIQLCTHWRRGGQEQINARQKRSRRENQRVSGIANWVETERDKTKQNRKKIKNNARGFEGDRECRHKIIPGYHFVLTIASPPMT
jgi:hypothetical protein